MDVIAQARIIVADYHSKYGAACTVKGLTYNAVNGLYEPPYVNVATGLYCSIKSLTSISDPNIASVVQTLEISFRAYRLITVPYGLVTVLRDFIIAREPYVEGVSATYQVVEAVAPDETASVELILHCRKLGVE